MWIRKEVIEIIKLREVIMLLIILIPATDVPIKSE